MTITVLYFAAVRELVGRDEEVIDLPSEVTTIGDLGAFLPRRHPVLDGRLRSVRFARNESFANDGEVLVAGDIVALIPPVAGG